ncbi:MAG TPA: TonB-dependent receptor, partial [Sphingomicrobium sp.]|nr:TonB-dependent receptor [Sphingomicrobium sp.]
ALFAGSRQSLDARLFGGDRWAGGFVSLAGSFARGDGFIPVVEQDRGPADRRAPYRQGSARGRLVQALGQATEAHFNLAYSSDHRDRGFDGSDNRQRATDAAIRLLGRGSMPWSALVYFQDRYFNSQFASLNGTRSISTLTLDQHVPSRGWGALAEIAPRLGPLETRLGAEWRGVSGYTEEEFRFVAESPTRQREAGGQSRTIGLFAITNWSAGGLSAAIEARLDHWAIDGGRLIETDLAGATLTNLNFDRRSGWEGSGRLALGRKIGSAMNVRAGAYGSWRLPTLNELYRPFRVGPDATAANGRLDPERLRGIEAGVDWKPAGTVKLSATMFANRLEGAIANVTLGAGPGTFPGVGFVAAGGIYRQRHNIDSILSRGLEVDASTERGPWQARLSYALTKARLRATGPGAALDGKQPAQVPRHSASASIGWSRSDLSADLAIRYVGAQFEDDINVRRLPGGLTVDSRASIPLGRRMAVELRGENLLDRRVLAGIAADGTRERALPRTFWLGLRLR